MEIDKKRALLKHNLDSMWNFYDEVEQFVSQIDSPREVPDFSGYVESVIKEPKDPFLEVLDTASISQIAFTIKSCKRCSLSVTRTHSVPGSGVINAKVMVVGEGPGESEDLSGEPFVGKAGVFLDSWLHAISLSRTENVFITNVVKCRPPGNRNPLPEEIETCEVYLDRQIALIKPEVILCVGKVAGNHLLHKSGTLSSLRGKFYNYHSIPLLVTYHPAAVLRNLALKRDVWNDLQLLAQFLHLQLKRKGE